MRVTWPRDTAPGTRPGGAGRPPLPYVPGLDGVRAIAVLAVLAFHGSVVGLPGGFLGVDVFFVLSGFLITALLLVEAESARGIGLRAFYLRRARRLLPALLLVLIGTALLALTVARDAALQVRDDTLAALTYTSNWWYVVQDQSYFDSTGRPPMLQHLWSLAVEEQFYLLWPLLVLLLWRRGGTGAVRRWALIGVAGSTLLSILWSVATGVPGRTDSGRIYFGTDTHAMGLLLGAALATVWHPALLPRTLRARARRQGTAAGIASIMVLVACFALLDPQSPALYRGGLLVVAVASAVLVATVCHPALPIGRWLSVPVLRYLGTRSYGIYLWHWPIFMVTRPGIDIGLEGAPAFVARIALTLAVAELSYRYVETPVRRGVLDRWWAGVRLRAPRSRAVLAATVLLPVLLLGTGLTQAAVPGPERALDGLTGIGDGPLAPVATDGAGGAGAAAVPPPAGDPTAEPAPVDRTVTAVGDSVLLDAAPELAALVPELVVDARIGRQPWTIFDRVRERHRLGRLGGTVVLNAGSNGLVQAGELTDVLGLLADRKRVVLVTSRGRKSWVASSNRATTKVAPQFPNVRVVDWAGISKGKRGWFWSDGLHMKQTGAQRYAAAVAAAVHEE